MHLNDRDWPGALIKYDEKVEAEIIALACSECPKGRLRWTIELLTHHAKKIAGLENINRESVRLVLKKTGLSLCWKRCGVSENSPNNTE